MRVACTHLPVTAIAAATMDGAHLLDDNRYGDDLFWYERQVQVYVLGGKYSMHLACTTLPYNG